MKPGAYTLSQSSVVHTQPDDGGSEHGEGEAYWMEHARIGCHCCDCREQGHAERIYCLKLEDIILRFIPP